MSFHQMYRRTTLGNTLQEALDDMVDHKLLPSKTATKIIQKFDQCISTALARRVKNRLNVRGHLNTYRFCDNVWTFVMNNVEIKDASTVIAVDKMKIVACEGKCVRPGGAAGGNQAAQGQSGGAGGGSGARSSGPAAGGGSGADVLSPDAAAVEDDSDRANLSGDEPPN